MQSLRMPPFFVKLIRRFLAKLKKHRINLTKKGDIRKTLNRASPKKIEDFRRSQLRFSVQKMHAFCAFHAALVSVAKKTTYGGF